MFRMIVSPLIISCELCMQLMGRYSMFSFHIVSIIFNATKLKEFKHSVNRLWLFCLWGIRSIPALMWYSKCIAYNVERRCNDALVGVLCKICPPGETTGKTFVDPNHPTGFFATAQFTSHRENEHSVKHFKGIICRRNRCATGSHQRSFNSVGASLFCQITPKNSRRSLRNDVTSGIGLNYLHFPKLIPRIF